MVTRSLQKDYDLYDVLRAACLHPVQHYKLPVGLLRQNDPADFIVVNNLTDFDVLQTYIDGQLMAEKGKTLLPFIPATPINKFEAKQKKVNDFQIKAKSANPVIRVIEAIEGQLVTNCLQLPAKVENEYIVSDLGRDILKIAVINRYEDNATPAISFIKNFGLKKGAIASTVAHDCHNIIAIGVDDDAICAAVNALIMCKGGISVARDKEDITCLPLPIAGLMSLSGGYEVAEAYTYLNEITKELGSTLHAPFMTLSFMALLVIPSLKLSDKGLFDGSKFTFTDIEV